MMRKILRVENPELFAEWDYDRNVGVDPDNLTGGSNKKVWWKCDKGHSWQAVVASRNRGRGCPYCSNRTLLAGFNDLLTIAPELAAEWDYERNEGLRPEDVLAGTHKAVWWKCRHGHSWKARVAERRLGRGCPYDAGKRIFEGFNDLKTRYPEVCEEWDYEKNGGSRPEQMPCGSREIFWWKCRGKGHNYQSSVINRVHGNSCPYCSGKRPVVGETDFCTIHPELMCEWDFEKNSSLLPQHITVGSDKKIWWRCKEGHSWQTTAVSRHYGTKCPVCESHKDRHTVITGTNDLATVCPLVAAEWDFERNDNLCPQDVLPYSTRYVWWRCEHGHHWKTKVQARVKGTTCPYCTGKTPLRARLI